MIESFKPMVTFYDTSFYDKESAHYSGKRYGTTPRSYVQFFFQERLRLVTSLVGKHVRGAHLTLIEDGCADGIVAQMVVATYPIIFSKVVGTDISPGMISAAREFNKNPRASFFLKHELAEEVKADVFLAIGFVSPGIFEDEFSFIQKHLKNKASILVSLASRNSIHTRLKLRGKEIVNDYGTFEEYERYFREKFEIVDRRSYGVFVPKLWAFPAVARTLQPIFEAIGRMFPSLCHETLYVLSPKEGSPKPVSL